MPAWLVKAELPTRTAQFPLRAPISAMSREAARADETHSRRRHAEAQRNAFLSDWFQTRFIVLEVPPRCAAVRAIQLHRSFVGMKMIRSY
jgi:hypothetical protein